MRPGRITPGGRRPRPAPGTSLDASPARPPDDPRRRRGPAPGGGGAIVNTASISAHIAQRRRWTYNTAKAAVLQLTRCAALDLAERGIRVNSVSPALIWTRELAKGLERTADPDTYRGIWKDFHMLRRIADPLACAGPVMMLTSFT